MIDFLSLIYPNVCGFCNNLDRNSLCPYCIQKVKKYDVSSIQYCINKNYNYCINMLKYENIVREKLIEYKFADKAFLYKTFTKIILNNQKVCRFLQKYDIIFFVPMNKNKKFFRGYNQSELIAKELHKKLNLPISAGNLIKIKNTQKQSTLTKLQRYENVKNAFFIKRPELVSGKNVILVDDIFTTGSTVNECSKVLKRAGAASIVVLTIARD